MTLVSPELKNGVRRLFERLETQKDPSLSRSPTVAEAKMTGPQSSVAAWPAYSVASDEPTSIGGTDRAPAPSSMFMASIGFAENVIFARQAVLEEVDFDSLETRVEGVWDRRGIFGIGGIDPSVSDLLIVTKVGTSAPPERVREVLRLTDKRCPMTTTLAKAAKVRRMLLVNGKAVPL